MTGGVTDPYAALDTAPPSRAPKVLALLALFSLGFVAVLGMLFLRAPRDLRVAEPPGYVRISDADSGGGNLSASRTASTLGLTGVNGFERGVLRAFGRPGVEPPRAVVVMVVEQSSAERARELHDAAIAAMARRGATAFATPEGFHGYHDAPDTSGRHRQRVAFRRGDEFHLVTVYTQAREDDTSEVVELARAQARA